MAFFSPSDLVQKLPLNGDTFSSIAKHRSQVQEIVQGNSPLLAIIVGPCSLHDKGSALIYAKKLLSLQKKVEKTCFLVMRVHVEKPRTYLGWKGFAYDPDLKGESDLEKGIFKSRELYLEIANLGVPLATEFLEPLISPYLADLVSWGFIGARTSSSQIHRQLASSFPFPVGFKNSVEGNLEGAILGAMSARHPHNFLHTDMDGKISPFDSEGNLHSHIVLRGDQNGPNYSASDIQKAFRLSEEKGLKSRILIDCAHGNSEIKPLDQKKVCENVLEQCIAGNRKIMGMMMESHLKEGNQPITGNIDPSISLTDPCMNWEETESLIEMIHENLLESSLCLA